MTESQSIFENINLFLGTPEAGDRAKDKIIKTEEKVATRVEETKNRLIDRLNASKVSARNKLSNIFNKAAEFGIENIVNSVVASLQKVYELPAAINDFRSEVEFYKAQRQEMKAQMIQAEATKKLEILTAQFNKLQQATNDRLSHTSLLRNEANKRSFELSLAAQDRRARAQSTFDIKSLLLATEAK